MKHAKQSANIVPFFMLLTVEMEAEIVYTSSRGATLEVRLLVVEDICFICTKMISIKRYVTAQNHATFLSFYLHFRLGSFGRVFDVFGLFHGILHS